MSPAAAGPSAAHRQRAEVAGYRDMWAACPAPVRRRHGIAALDVGSGVCLGSAAHSGSTILNHAVGVGVAEPAGDAEVDAIEGFYADLGVRFHVAVAAGAEGLRARLRERGYAPGRPWTTFHREVADPGPPAAGAPRVSEAEGPADAAAFAEIVVRAFDMPDDFGDWFAALVGRPPWTCLLARDGATPIAAGALLPHGDTAWIAFGSTLPEHRGRGAQGALFAERARRAAAAGLRHMVTETGSPAPGEGPGPSHRNMMRAGFRAMEERPNLAPPG